MQGGLRADLLRVVCIHRHHLLHHLHLLQQGENPIVDPRRLDVEMQQPAVLPAESQGVHQAGNRSTFQRGAQRRPLSGGGTGGADRVMIHHPVQPVVMQHHQRPVARLVDVDFETVSPV